MKAKRASRESLTVSKCVVKRCSRCGEDTWWHGRGPVICKHCHGRNPRASLVPGLRAALKMTHGYLEFFESRFTAHCFIADLKQRIKNERALEAKRKGRR